MKFDDMNTSNAEYIYSVANTPMFIVRKLKIDPLVLGIAHGHSVEQIYETLASALSTPPQSARSRVIPLILLVALGMKSDRQKIESAINLPSTGYRWYKLVGDALLSSMVNVTKGRIATKIMQAIPERSISSNATNNRYEILAS